MENIEKKNQKDIDRIKKFLEDLGFICKSYPSAQHLIYSKNGNTIIIKNKVKK